MGGLSLIGAILIVAFPSVQDYFGVLEEGLVATMIGALIVTAFFFLCEWGLRKRHLAAYVGTWFSLILIVLRLGLIGLVLAGARGFWLVKCKDLFIGVGRGRK